MIRFLKVMDAPATWVSQPVFAQPRYLIRSAAGRYDLHFRPSGATSYLLVGCLGTVQEAQQAAADHDSDMVPSDGEPLHAIA